MAQLMLINPAKRPKKRKASPAQLRALAAGRRKRAGVAANPAPRRRRRSMRAVARSTRRRASRNPIGVGGVMQSVIGAAQGAGGALAVNAVFGMLPLPDTLKTGLGGTATKMALALGMGMAGKKILGRAAVKMAEGAMTVAAYDAMKMYLPASMGGEAPSEAVAGLGYYGPAINAGTLPGIMPNTSMQNSMGEYVSGMGEYVY